MNILVTGANSKAGVEIVNRLRGAGVRVRTTAHLSAHGTGREAGRGVAVDFLRPETLDAAFSGMDVAVLIIPENSSMVAMAANLAAAAEKAQVKRVVYLSFLHADKRIGGPLLAWHGGAERVVLTSPVPSTCLRPNYYMQNFLSAYVPAASIGGGRISYVDAADVAEVVARVSFGRGHERKVYSLTGARALTAGEVVELLRGEVGPPLTYAARGWEDACLLGRRSAQSALKQVLCEFWLAASDDVFAVTTDDFERLTQRRPRSFESFVRQHRGQFRAVSAA